MAELTEQEKDARCQIVIEASQLTADGNYIEASKKLKALLDQYPESSFIASFLAHTYLNLEQLEKANYYYNYAIGKRPDNPRASIGLFHCLLDQGKKREAFAEMDRFMKIAECDDYNGIRKEILEKYGSIENYLS